MPEAHNNMHDDDDSGDIDEGNEAATYGKYTEYDNVYDFTEYKLHQLVEYAASKGRADLASSMLEALDAYMLGNIDIVFIDGWPAVSRKILNADNEQDT
jgi:hypothetical protein